MVGYHEYDSTERVGTHEDGGKSCIKRDEEDIIKLIKIITEQTSNPFNLDDESNALYNLATGLVMPPDSAKEASQVT